MTDEDQGSIPIGHSAGMGGSSPANDGSVIPSRARSVESTPSPGAGAPISADSIPQSLAAVNTRLAHSGHVLVLRIDPVTGTTIAEVRQAATGQVLQRIPSRDQQHLADLLASWANGKSILADVLA